VGAISGQLNKQTFLCAAPTATDSLQNCDSPHEGICNSSDIHVFWYMAVFWLLQGELDLSLFNFH